MHDQVRAAGVLLGTAIGDAVGLAFEGMSPRRVGRRLARRPLGPAIWPLGVVSDDTEHAALTARALVESRGDPARFGRLLGRSLRRWLWGLPPGIGWATLRALVKLSVGIPVGRSGVWSAGNGPMMRAPVLGIAASDDAQLETLIAISTRATHTDPRAEDAALAVARLARRLPSPASGTALIASLAEQCRTAPLRSALEAVVVSLEEQRSPAEQLGWQGGVSGYCVDSAAAALWAWATHRRDPRAAIETAVRLGGDTDSVAAIAGALAGAEHGVAGLPRDWLVGIADWPLSRGHLASLAAALAGDMRLPRDRWWLAAPRNLVVGTLMVAHVVRRLAW